MSDSFCLESAGSLTAVRDRLQRAFGVPFTTWSEDAGHWYAAEETGLVSEGDELLDDDLALWLNSQSERLQTGQSAALPLDQTWLALAIPAGSSCGPLTVAIGAIRADGAALATVAGDVLHESLQGTIEVSSLQSMIDDFRQQVTDGFEERAYLRQIACYAETTSVEKSIAEVAAEILPQLKELGRFRSLSLIESTADDAGNVVPGRIVASAETDGVTPADLHTLLNRFANPCQTRPVVRAAERSPQLRAIAPEVHSFAISTLIREDEHFGWLIAVDREPTSGETAEAGHHWELEIGSVEASLLEATGILLASHIHNQRLFQEKERLTTELVRSLVAVLDARDEYTCGHSDRVAAMARELALSLKLPADECETVYLSGLLHDLGKVGVSDDVLLKPEQLSPEEFAQIKEHPQRGYDMLKRLEPLRDMLPGVLHHHEAWNGRGYPHGLQGEEIPLIARILAVADSFDAMTSDRPYRTGMPLERAVQILAEGAGQQWDARLIGRFLSKLPRMVDICRQSRARMDRILQRDGRGSGPADTPAEHGPSQWDDSVTGEIEHAVALRGATRHPQKPHVSS